MLWIYLIILQILFFIGLLFFLRYVLTRNISKATGRLHALSKDYAAKEEQANKILQSAHKEAKSILAKETQAAEETRKKLINEAHEQKERILQEATQKGDGITEKAQRNADFLLNEINQKIDARANEKIMELMHKAIPKDFLEDIHQRWVDESDKGVFHFKHLKLPEKVKEVKIVSAFPLSDRQQEDLKKKLKAKIGTDAALKTQVDPALIAGFVISIGSVVVDASLKYKIQQAMRG